MMAAGVETSQTRVQPPLSSKDLKSLLLVFITTMLNCSSLVFYN
jgi:hypothetical protein